MKAMMLALALSISTAVAAEPTGTMTLACEGTMADNVKPDAKPKPISMGIIVDFTARTVEFGHEVMLPVPITYISQTTVLFFGDNLSDPVLYRRLDGTIDRLTGTVEAKLFFRWRKCDTPCAEVTQNYVLKCKPTQRMF
jgi:hypothetical protein